MRVWEYESTERSVKVCECVLGGVDDEEGDLFLEYDSEKLMKFLQKASQVRDDGTVMATISLSLSLSVGL